jgi:hypothetical protein
MGPMPGRIYFSFSVAVVLWFSCLAFAQTQSDELSAEEYRVLAAAIDTFRNEETASHPLIADHTSTFECGSSCNDMQIGGCNGLRAKRESPAERLAIVKRDLPDLEKYMVSDFISKNGRCSEITKKIPAASPYFLFGSSTTEKPPAGWEHPDYFYFSRVAFNREQTQALVNISFISGSDSGDSRGRYFLFTKKNGKWMPVTSSAVWDAQTTSVPRP